MLRFSPHFIVRALSILQPGRLALPAAIVLAAIGSLACSSHTKSDDAAAPPINGGIPLPEATDLDPDPAIVELDLEARPAVITVLPGIETQTLTYNGAIPGPLIRAHVGDRIIVHFKNSLSESTTVHWHGIRVPAAMDGTPATQEPVMPGGTFDYDFRVPDAGLYWYHPHVHSALQVAEGLYGALLVEDKSEPASLGDEVVMVLSDIDVGPDGGLNPPVDDPASQLFGTEGNVILVNGRSKPRLAAHAGRRQRWRIVNAARTRYFQLSLAGHSFTRIGGDAGFIEAPVQSDMLVLTPGERADVLVTPTGAPGSDHSLMWIPYDRGFGTVLERQPEEVLTMHLDDGPASEMPPVPESLRTIEPLSTQGAIERELTFLYDGARFAIQGTEGPEQMLMGKTGTTEVWHVKNVTDWDHPFHLHGFFFQPLDSAGVPIHEWKDTLNLPTMKQIDFVVHFDDRPGNWMFHCHILEHSEVGLMGMLMLEE